MTPRHALVIVLVAALALMTLQPAPAEAVEPFTALAIAGAAVAVVILVAYLIVANVEESRRRAEITPDTPVLVAYAPPAPGGDAAYSAP